MRYFPETDSVAATQDHAWMMLESVAEVEAWLDLNDRQLRQAISEQPKAAGYHGCGICFGLTHGGEIYLHTNSEGEVLLDVTPEANWATPVIAAVTQAQPPNGQVWILPPHILIELIMGLNSLIASSRLVLSHEFHRRR